MDDPTKPRSGKTGAITRREFARRAALASAVAAVAPAVAVSTPAAAPHEHANVTAADPGARLFDSSGKISSAEQQPTDVPKLSPESHAEAEARHQTVLAQYGSRFSDPQKADIRRLCFFAQPPLDRLRAYALDNGDSPALYLKPLVEREKNPLENTRVGKTPDAAAKP
jgi:hypothetical protein